MIYPCHFDCCYYCSVARWCATNCDPMYCSTSGFLSPRVCSNSCPLSQWCHTTISSSVISFSSYLQSFPESGTFPMSQLFASGGQSIGVSASTSVLPMKTQDLSSLGCTDWISLQSKGLSRVFSSTIVWKHQLFGTQPSLWCNSTFIHDYWKNHSFDYIAFNYFVLIFVYSMREGLFHI